MIAANNGHVVALDNLSRLPSWLSDALCVLATGGGLGKRQLFTDDDEIILNAVRPIIMNGIEELATRGDLLDRAILSYLPEISEEKRRQEKVLEREFKAARPKILGALLDGVVMALRREDKVSLDHLPRMADFAMWITAAEPALGWKEGRFIHAYEQDRKNANALALEASVIANEVEKLKNLPWEGTAEELLQKLNDQATEATRRKKTWPADATRLSGALRRIVPNLRSLGIAVEFDKREPGTGRRLISVRKEGFSAAAASQRHRNEPGRDAGDASDTELHISNTGRGGAELSTDALFERFRQAHEWLIEHRDDLWKALRRAEDQNDPAAVEAALRAAVEAWEASR